MKRLIFQIALSVALFCVLSVMFTVSDDVEGDVFDIKEQSGEEITELTQNETYKCVGAPIEITEAPRRVRGGDTLVLTFKGETYTEYSIKLYYPSGLSASDELVSKKSDGKGCFGWEITVSPNVSVGKLRISVLSEKSHLLTDIEIIG